MAAISGLTIPKVDEQSSKILSAFRALTLEISGVELTGRPWLGDVLDENGLGNCRDKTSNTVRVTANWGDDRATRKREPLNSALTPSSRAMVRMASIVPLY